MEITLKKFFSLCPEYEREARDYIYNDKKELMSEVLNNYIHPDVYVLLTHLLSPLGPMYASEDGFLIKETTMERYPFEELSLSFESFFHRLDICVTEHKEKVCVLTKKARIGMNMRVKYYLPTKYYIATDEWAEFQEIIKFNRQIKLLQKLQAVSLDAGKEENYTPLDADEYTPLDS